MPVEERGADNCVHNVIREGHAADRCQPTREGKQRCSSGGQHDCTYPTEAYQETSPIVGLGAVEEGVTEIPAGREITMRAIQCDRNTNAQSNGNHRPIQGRWPLGAENAQLEKCHAGQHQSRHPPECEHHEEDGFHLH